MLITFFRPEGFKCSWIIAWNPRPGTRLLDGEKEKKAASELSEGLGGRRGLFPTSSLPFFPSPPAHNFSPLPQNGEPELS